MFQLLVWIHKVAALIEEHAIKHITISIWNTQVRLWQTVERMSNDEGKTETGIKFQFDIQKTDWYSKEEIGWTRIDDRNDVGHSWERIGRLLFRSRS